MSDAPASPNVSISISPLPSAILCACWYHLIWRYRTCSKHVTIMASSKFGRKLNPYRSLRDPLGVKGVRQSVVITHHLSTIGPGQQLTIRFPSRGRHDVIVPGTVRSAFMITLNSDDPNRTLVQNIGRAIVKMLCARLLFWPVEDGLRERKRPLPGHWYIRKPEYDEDSSWCWEQRWSIVRQGHRRCVL